MINFVSLCPSGHSDSLLPNCFSVTWPKVVLLHEVIPPKLQSLAFSFVELHEASVVPFLVAVGHTTVKCVSHCSQFCIICNPDIGVLCAVIQVVPLNSTDPGISPWTTPSWTNLKLEVMPLITVLWIWQVRQFQSALWSIYLAHFSQLAYEEVLRHSLTKVEICNIHLLLHYFSVLTLKYKNIWDAIGENVIKSLKLRCMTFLRFALSSTDSVLG